MKLGGMDFSKLVKQDDKENSRKAILAVCCTVACAILLVYNLVVVFSSIF